MPFRIRITLTAAFLVIPGLALCAEPEVGCKRQTRGANQAFLEGGLAVFGLPRPCWVVEVPAGQAFSAKVESDETVRLDIDVRGPGQANYRPLARGVPDYGATDRRGIVVARSDTPRGAAPGAPRGVQEYRITVVPDFSRSRTPKQFTLSVGS